MAAGQTRRIAIIPARAGSKRLPGKNTLQLGKYPLIAWTIRAAIDSGVFTRVIVSTDSEEIAEIARAHGAEAPFIRPPELASDTASSADVVLHALSVVNDPAITDLCLLQPTSPFRTAEHIRAALGLMTSKNADNVVSVCECEHSPLWSNALPDSGAMHDFIRPEYRGKRSQDLPPFYRINGAIYWVNVTQFLKQRSFFLEAGSYAYKMSAYDSIDIDHQLDFEFCEFLISRGQST